MFIICREEKKGKNAGSFQYFRYICTMIDLAQHIESLLLENDCVIVPGLGGFITHYTSAERIEDEQLFLPPVRKVGFNPQLKLNDGLLVQSYMSVYGTNFPDANKQVNKEIQALFQQLHEEGKIDLPNVGELRCTIHGTYDFIPYDQKLATPSLYGLDSFEMRKLSDLPMQAPARTTLPMQEEVPAATRRTLHLHPYRWAGIAAMIAVIMLSFFFSAPIENTEIMSGNYARLLPEQLFGQLEGLQLTVTPISVQQPSKTRQTPADKPAKEQSLKEKETEEAESPQTDTEETEFQEAGTESTGTAGTGIKETETKPVLFHVIIASVGTQADADNMARRLVAQGYASASVISGNGRIRVSLCSYATEQEAYRKIAQLRNTDDFPGAWVLKN